MLKKPSRDREQFNNLRPLCNLAYVRKLIENIAVDTALVKIVNGMLCQMDNTTWVALGMLDH